MGRKARMKNCESKSSFDNLPPETIVNILLKLPVKSIIRSTLVCKTWYNLIRNPNFISAQIQHSVSSCDENAVLIVPPIVSHQNYCSLVSADTSLLIEKFEIPFNINWIGSLKLVASLNGLLLLSVFNASCCRDEFYLWNPCIRRHRALVPTNINFDTWTSKLFFVVGLGFRKPTNDYRVVRIIYVVDSSGKVFGNVAPKVEIYSLREHTWQEVKDPKVPRLFPDVINGTCFNGKFYWLATIHVNPSFYLSRAPIQRGTYEDRNENWILSFDFDIEEFGEALKLPDDVSNCLGKAAKFKLMEFEGSLCICVFDNCDVQSSCIWTMRSEDGVISWRLSFRVLLKESGWPMNITRSGSLIVESYCNIHVWTRSIMSCNLKSMHYKDLGSCQCDEHVAESITSATHSTVDTSFMESLVMYDGDQAVLL